MKGTAVYNVAVSRGCHIVARSYASDYMLPRYHRIPINKLANIIFHFNNYYSVLIN